jgi:hypothetical protein
MGLDLAEAGGDQTVIHDPISELSNTIGPKA